MIEEVGVDLPAAPLLFLLECSVPPEDKTGVFAPAPFVVSSSFLRSSSALVTAFCAFVSAAEISFSCFLVFASALQAAAADFFLTIPLALAFFSALRSATACVLVGVLFVPVRVERRPRGPNDWELMNPMKLSSLLPPEAVAPEPAILVGSTFPDVAITEGMRRLQEVGIIDLKRTCFLG